MNGNRNPWYFIPVGLSVKCLWGGGGCAGCKASDITARTPRPMHTKYITAAHWLSLLTNLLQRFSPCSRRAIGRCLVSKASLCFEDSSAFSGPDNQCGNSRIDPGEECDPGGRRNGAPSDGCCTPRCKLKPGASCSPFNHQCCTPGKRRRPLLLP